MNFLDLLTLSPVEKSAAGMAMAAPLVIPGTMGPVGYLFDHLERGEVTYNVAGQSLGLSVHLDQLLPLPAVLVTQANCLGFTVTSEHRIRPPVELSELLTGERIQHAGHFVQLHGYGAPTFDRTAGELRIPLNVTVYASRLSWRVTRLDITRTGGRMGIAWLPGFLEPSWTWGGGPDTPDLTNRPATPPATMGPWTWWAIWTAARWALAWLLTPRKRKVKG